VKLVAVVLLLVMVYFVALELVPWERLLSVPNLSRNMDTETYVKQQGTPMIEPYAAKDYTQWYQDTTSEVLSVGMEKLYANPLDLAARDPELF